MLLAVFVAVIWVLAAVDFLTDNRLAEYGIVPRTVDGLWGIPLAPFLHGGFGHALSNTVPLLLLGGLVATRGWQTLLGVTLFVVLLGGAGVWLVARGGSHIGASGLVFGYFGYLVARGWYDRRIVSILIAVVVHGGIRRAAIRRTANGRPGVVGGPSDRAYRRRAGRQVQEV